MYGNCKVCGQRFGRMGDGRELEACEHIIQAYRIHQPLEVTYDHLDKIGTAFYQEGNFISEPEALERIRSCYPGNVITIIGHSPPSKFCGLSNDGHYTFTMVAERTSE